MGTLAVVGFSFSLRAMANPDIPPIITSSSKSENEAMSICNASSADEAVATS